MRNSTLFLAFVLLALPFAESSGRHHHHHPHIHGRGHDEKGGVGGGGGGRVVAAWPCCDNCGGCTKSIPPQCQCMDARPAGCHPACKSCVKSSLSVSPPVYQCMDSIPNLCLRRCTAAAA